MVPKYAQPSDQEGGMSGPQQAWPPAPGQPHLGEHEVHLWSASLERPADEVDRLAQVLTAEERERAARFKHRQPHDHFVLARGTLRLLLARYLGAEPATIGFRFGPQGKPYLAEPAWSWLQFNISHSHGLALYAFTRHIEVGVDVEQVRPFNDLAFAERFFTPGEVESLRLVAPERRTEVFFHAWTRKEAILKATGEGIAYGLEHVEVTVSPEEPPRIVRLNGDSQPGAHWFLCALVPASGYVGALALPRRTTQLLYWHWPGPTPHTNGSADNRVLSACE
jgi:4'-phosphopantetheinyl transferase